MGKKEEENKLLHRDGQVKLALNKLAEANEAPVNVWWVKDRSSRSCHVMEMKEMNFIFSHQSLL